MFANLFPRVVTVLFLGGVAFGCTNENKETNVPDATIINEAAAPPSGHAHPENMPDTMHIEESDTAVHKKK